MLSFVLVAATAPMASAEPMEQQTQLPIKISVRGARVTGHAMAVSAVIPGATPRGVCYYMFDILPTQPGQWSTRLMTAAPAIVGGCRVWRFRVPSIASGRALHVAALATVYYYDGAGSPVYAAAAEWGLRIWRGATSRNPSSNLALTLVDLPNVRVVHVGEPVTVRARRTHGRSGVYVYAFPPGELIAAAVWNYGASEASITFTPDRPGVWTIEASGQTTRYDPVTDDEQLLVLP
jgi:hypothetical protein